MHYIFIVDGSSTKTAKITCHKNFHIYGIYETITFYLKKALEMLINLLKQCCMLAKQNGKLNTVQQVIFEGENFHEFHESKAIRENFTLEMLFFQ